MDSFGVLIFQSFATDSADKCRVYDDLPFAVPRPLVQAEGGLRAVGPSALAATERLHCAKNDLRERPMYALVYDSIHLHTHCQKGAKVSGFEDMCGLHYPNERLTVMGLIKTGLLLITITSIAKFFSISYWNPPQVEESHDIMCTCEPPVAACLGIMSQNWDKILIVAAIGIAMCMVIACALMAVCRKSPPVVATQVDTNSIRVLLVNASGHCDAFLADVANVHEIQKVKALLKTSLDCLNKAKTD